LENDDMQYNADTGITDYTATAHFCVARRLAINHYANCEEVVAIIMTRRIASV